MSIWESIPRKSSSEVPWEISCSETPFFQRNSLAEGTASIQTHSAAHLCGFMWAKALLSPQKRGRRHLPRISGLQVHQAEEGRRSGRKRTGSFSSLGGPGLELLRHSRSRELEKQKGCGGGGGGPPKAGVMGDKQSPISISLFPLLPQTQAVDTLYANVFTLHFISILVTQLSGAISTCQWGGGNKGFEWKYFR